MGQSHVKGVGRRKDALPRPVTNADQGKRGGMGILLLFFSYAGTPRTSIKMFCLR